MQFHRRDAQGAAKIKKKPQRREGGKEIKIKKPVMYVDLQVVFTRRV
jgi:hypothetical protein